MTKASQPASQRRRAPNGMDKPFSVRLTPDERQAVQRLAADRGTSLSHIARQCVLRGLASYQKSCTPTSAD